MVLFIQRASCLLMAITMMKVQMHNKVNNSNKWPLSAVLMRWQWVSSLAQSLSSTCTWSSQVTYFSHSSLLASIGFLLPVVTRAMVRESLPFYLLHIFHLVFWNSDLCNVKEFNTSFGLMTTTPASYLRPAATWICSLLRGDKSRPPCFFFRLFHVSL